MARSLAARVASRGFPSEAMSGMSGQGSLPDSTLPSGPQAGQPVTGWQNPNVDPGGVAASMPPPELYTPLGGLWGLPAGVNPSDTPHTHAAPMADPTLPVGEYLAEADATHAALFNGWQLREHPPTLATFPMDRTYQEGGGPSAQQPVAGPLRALAGFDAVQGFGGGGPGPGGLNPDMPMVTDQRAYPGQVYTPYVNASETPFLVPASGQFIASEPSLPPFSGGGYDVPTANVSAQQPAGPDVPATGPAVGTAPPAVAAYTPGFWG